MKSRAEYTRYLFFLIPILLLLIPLPAIGRAFRLNFLPDEGENFGCATCHINAGGGGPRNPFGQDWEAIAIARGDKYVPDMAERDSDGDGFTNDEEFEAGTHPGDSESKPPEPRPVRPRGKLTTLWSKIRSGSRHGRR